MKFWRRQKRKLHRRQFYLIFTVRHITRKGSIVFDGRMVNWFDNDEEEQRARDSLLRHYSSECMSHGAYIVTVAIGALTFVQATPYIQDIIPVEKGILISFAFSLLLTAFIFLASRIIFWGTIASTILHVRPATTMEIKREFGKDFDNSPLLVKLEFSCIMDLKKIHPWLYEFAGPMRSTARQFLHYFGLFLLLFFFVWFILPKIIT